ncbi:MAG: 6-phosphogluconolactonase [Terriglobales bacterium]
MHISLRILSESGWANSAADLLQAWLARREDAVVGFPTGDTPLPFYAELRRRAQAGTFASGALRAVMLDEYLLLPTSGASGAGEQQRPRFFCMLQEQLFTPLGIPQTRVLKMPAHEENLAASCERFEQQLQHWGGCDLLFLGLGRNGHIAFNEPGTAFLSRTRQVQLRPESVTTNAAGQPGSAAPGRAVSMGIATILSARQICLLVRGEHKAAILRRILDEPVSPELPASFLRLGANVVILADQAAAGHLPTTMAHGPESGY